MLYHGYWFSLIAFRMYVLVLSMISIYKLIMFDIKYDSTIENAVSIFVSGALCFVISFLSIIELMGSWGKVGDINT